MGKAISILKIFNSNAPMTDHVFFFGAPDNRVYVIYALIYEASAGNFGLEFVIARLEEYVYDYEKKKLIDHKYYEKRIPLFKNAIEKPEISFEIIESSRIIKTFKEAEKQLNKLIDEKSLVA